MRGGVAYFRDRPIRGSLIDLRGGLIVFRDRLVRVGFSTVWDTV